jgi:hypothetical protein
MSRTQMITTVRAELRCASEAGGTEATAGGPA